MVITNVTKVTAIVTFRTDPRVVVSCATMSEGGSPLPNDVFLTRLRRFLEHQLGPAPRPTDAQIGMIIRFTERELKKTEDNGKK